MVLSGTNWTPETVETWLFQNCWPMGYRNFDAGRKADLRNKILHAIDLLSKWTGAIQPPEKSISAHDAMGGGDVMGGGGKNGWSYSFGKWPVQVQQQQPQPQALQQDWATNNDPPPQRHSCSPSPHPHSRRSSTKS